jgi:pimeloyl-ACP methyl ester carboxylesterase
MEKLSSVPAELVVLDFPGHGKSSHKSLDGTSTILMDLVYYVHDAIHQLKWNNEKDENDYVPPALIGHSMGGSVSLLYASAFPTSKLILLDSLGPHTKKATDVVKGFQKHVQQRLKGKPPCSIYPSLENAIATRCATAKAFPGNQYISKETATELVTWASSILPDGKLQFHHDQRLKWASSKYTCIATTSLNHYIRLISISLPFAISVVIDRWTGASTVPRCGCIQYENLFVAGKGWYAISTGGNCKGKGALETNNL